jgi:quercetin dioxygenase-like cupin family protein
MTADSQLVVVTEDCCNACGTPKVTIHHQSIPEMRVGGQSPEQAAQNLAARLETNLGAVSDPTHREQVRRAMADVQAFLAQGAALQPKLSEVIDVAVAGSATSGAPPATLAKTETLKIRRLSLLQGRPIPAHQVPGEITVHCLTGRIAFTAGGTTREVGAGQLVVLAAGEPHSLVGLEDSTVLVTEARVVAQPAP